MPPSPNAAAPSPPALTDRLLRSWLRCRRRAWLDWHGPEPGRQWSAHRALALEDQLRSFQTLLPQRPGRGEAACAAGAPGVVGVRLRGLAADRTPIEAHPPLLERVEGSSRWGAHRYRPVLGRQGRRTTREHRLLLALWGRLLAQHQEGAVPQGLVVAGAGTRMEREPVTLLGDSLQRQLDDSLGRLAGDLARTTPPPLVSDRKKCTLCCWRGLCDEAATEEGHLSEVSGIGGKRRELLIALGIGSLAELAAADPEALAERLAVEGEQHREAAAPLVAQARVQAAGVPRRRDDAIGAALPELEGAPGVLLYDIESDPDARDDFLHGVLRLRRRPDGSWPDPREAAVDATAAYQPLLALQEHGEPQLWARLERLLRRYPDWPVLHYGETESIGLLRLAERQGVPEAERARLRRRLVDVHQRLRRHWLLPVNSYGLKAVAGWIGFAWSQQGVDGARCLLWWRQWRRDREEVGVIRSRQRLQRIFRYNLDDSLATWAVAHWLLDQPAALEEPPSPPSPPSPP
jgi:uncharacterized protein